MTKHIAVPIFWFAVGMAMLTAFGASALTLLLLRWPVAVGVLMAFGVSALMLWGIVQVVTSGHQPLPTPARDATATVDGRAVKSVEVLQ